MKHDVVSVVIIEDCPSVDTLPMQVIPLSAGCQLYKKNKRKQKNRFPLYSGAPPLLINCKWFTPACPTRMHVICIFVLSFCTDGILLYTFFASGFFSAFTGSADVSNVTVLCSLQVGSFCLHAFSVFAKVCKRSPAKCQKTSWNNRL